MALLARTSLSDGARTLLGQRHVTELAHAHAAAHIDDDPADAYAALTAAAGEDPSPYDALTDEQRQRYAARALTEDARRRATAQFAEMERLEVAIEAGGASQADIEGSGLPDKDKHELMVLLEDRIAEEQAVATAVERFLDGGRWNGTDPKDQADANRIWSSRGGNADALAQQDRHAVLLLRRIARRTGIVPERARRALEIVAFTGTVQQREFADALLRSATADASLAEPPDVLDGASSFESDVQVADDFELTDEEMALVSRETPLAELAAWLRELRALNDLGADGSHDQTTAAAKKAAFRERIYRSFAGRDETMRLLHDRYRQVVGDIPDIHGHPAMFPAEFSARVGPSLDRRAELFGSLLDLMPVVGDLKAAAELPGLLAQIDDAITRGDRDAADAAQSEFIIKLTDLFPGPNIVGFANKMMRWIDGLPVAEAFKKKVREGLESRRLLDEDAWRRKVKGDRLQDSRYGGNLNARKKLDEVWPKAEGGEIHYEIPVTAPSGDAVIDGVRVRSGKGVELVEVKSEPADKTRKMQKRASQDRVYKDVAKGEAIFQKNVGAHFKKGEAVPGQEVRYLMGDPVPTGWRKYWRLRILRKLKERTRRNK